MQPKFEDWLERKPAGPKPRKRIPRTRPGRRAQNNSYARQRLAYLELHPFCQITIARHGLAEAIVILQGGFQNGVQVPRATQIHHRNKCRGVRKNDERWWMSGSWKGHDWIEEDKGLARQEGFLLPFEADADGRSPQGQALTTPEFMAARMKRA